MIVNASRSWAPTPTSRRTAPVCGIVDDAAHLEAAHLAGDDAVLDRRLGAAGDDRVDQRQVRRRGAGGGAERLDDGREQRALVDVPHLDRERRTPAARRASSPVSRSARTCSDVAPLRSAQASAGPSPRAGSSSTSTHATPSTTIAAPGREGADDGFDVVTEVIADERLQLDAAQPAAPVGLVEIGHAGRLPGDPHLPVLRAP